MLDKLMKELNEMNRLAQVYYKEEQWVLLEMVTCKMTMYTTMITNHLIKSEYEVALDDTVGSK
jgi:hypothetical protein